MFKVIAPVSLSLLAFTVPSTALATAQPIEEMVVQAEFTPKSALKSALSVSVIGEETLKSREAAHLEDILNLLPNVNFSSGASRGRFFQIRGIGERSQFVDPVNPSVGLMVDGIDFTGLGGAATTLDIAQVEVLRGPQGTLFGANALAGMINIVSEDAASEEGFVHLNLGNYNTREFSQAFGGEINEQLAARVALAKNTSDGYMRNAYLDKENTNGIDETTLRTKLSWKPSDAHALNVTYYFVDAKNGYDAFTLDNSRTTLSDEPGHDNLQTRAASAQHVFSGWDGVRWESSVSHANSNSAYGFDEDWTYRTICAEDADCAYWQYSTTDDYQREHQNTTFDSRLVSDSDAALQWVAGVYLRHQNEDLVRTYVNNDPNYSTFYGPITEQEVSLFDSQYDTENAALYGELSYAINDAVRVVGGVRTEQRTAEYSDSNGEAINTDEDLWGGKLAIEYSPSEAHFVYALASRGYKAGGNNVPGPVDEQGQDLIPIIFDTESLMNYEIGHKAQWAQGQLTTQTTFFYQDRADMQVRQSLVLSQETGEVGGECPCSFEDFIGNAAAGINYGAEFEIQAQAEAGHRAWLSLGLLHTEYEDFESYSHVDADAETGTPKVMDGRAQAHAPEYQAALGVLWAFSDKLTWQVDVEAKDAFYLSSRHEEKTEAYTLLNTRIEYTHGDWTLGLWGKNLSDEDTIVRGFGSFGNDPRSFYETEPYYQFGAPRTVGVSATVQLR